MSCPDGEAAAGVAGRLLSWAVRLLPAGRREWGQAMQAELAEIEAAAARRRFALGCIRVVLAQPALISQVGSPVLVAGVLAVAVALASGITYPALRGALIALAVILVVCSWLGRRFGPVGAGRAARVVRAGGYAIIGAQVLLIINAFRAWPTANPHEATTTGVPVYTVVMTIYTVALLSMTGRRSPIGMRTLAISAVLGLAAALAWFVPILFQPALPTSSYPAVLAVMVAATAAALAAAWRASRSEEHLTATLCAATVAALMIVVLANGLLQLFPRWVPDIGGSAFPPYLSAADRLAENENYAQDPYIPVLLLGCLLASALSMVVASIRRQRHFEPTDPARTVPSPEP